MFTCTVGGVPPSPWVKSLSGLLASARGSSPGAPSGAGQAGRRPERGVAADDGQLHGDVDDQGSDEHPRERVVHGAEREGEVCNQGRSRVHWRLR